MQDTVKKEEFTCNTGNVSTPLAYCIIAQYVCLCMCALYRLIVRCFSGVKASVITVQTHSPSTDKTLFLYGVSPSRSLFGVSLSCSAVESHTFETQGYHSLSIYSLFLLASVSRRMFHVFPPSLYLIRDSHLYCYKYKSPICK